MINRPKHQCLIYFAFTLLVLSGCGKPVSRELSARPQRIISTAPNTTEILFALGIGHRVVAVNRFSTYPPGVRELPRIGGLYDPNWEKIAALRPDLVVGLDTQQEIAENLKLLHIPFVGVSHERIDEVLNAILTIGRVCDAEEEAKELAGQLQHEMEAICSRGDAPAVQRDPLSVLVCISRDEAAQRCYIAAPETFYDELLLLAGGVNACAETAQMYPEISPEGLVALNPDVIIDIGPSAGLEAWQQYPTLPAVEHQRITVITNDYASIPGPRFVKLLADFRKAIEP